MKLARERVECNGTSSKVALEALRRAPILAEVPERALEELATVGLCRSYGPGQWIVDPAEREGAVCVIASGRAWHVHRSPSDREVAPTVFGPGDIFGLWLVAPVVELTGGLEAGPAGAVAHRIPVRRFRTFLEAHPPVAWRVLHVVCAEAVDLHRLVKALVLDDVRTRVAALLEELAGASPRRTLRLTQREIGSRVGARREGVNRAMAELREGGLIECHDQGLVVVTAARYG